MFKNLNITSVVFFKVNTINGVLKAYVKVLFGSYITLTGIKIIEINNNIAVKIPDKIEFLFEINKELLIERILKEYTITKGKCK